MAMSGESTDTDKYADKIARYTMLDNAFMNAVLQDNLPAVQCLVSAIIADKKLEVVSFSIQKAIQNKIGRASCRERV